MTKLERQLKLEEEMVGLGIDRYRKQRDSKEESDTTVGTQLVGRIIDPIVLGIELFMEENVTRKAGPKHRASHYLNVADYDVAAMIAAKVCVNALSNVKGNSLQAVAAGIGGLIKDELDFQRFKAEAPGMYFTAKKKADKGTTQRYKRAVMRHYKGFVSVDDLPWSESDRVILGTVLAEIACRTTGLFQMQTIHNSRNRSKTILVGTEAGFKWIEDGHAAMELLSPLYMPMLVTPTPWEGVTGGGYLTLGKREKLVKASSSVLKDIAQVDMPDVLGAVNALQSTPWRINKSVYEVMYETWQAGGLLGGLPAREDEPLPAKPSNMEDPEAKHEWKRSAAQAYDRNARLRSKRVGVAQKLALAKRFLEEEELYFVHTVDWRGRAYPVATFVHPQADDAGKALLQFAEGKEIGDGGGYWLAVHGANLFGVDKCSFDERVEWVESNREAILDSGFNPLDGGRFWSTADKPWQALAWCMEWAGFMVQGESYVSHIPVAMDGSCNGLQNYSAMLRDEVGGRATNLVPNEVPADIYLEVASVVSDHVDKDAAKGNEVAALWVGNVTRKIVKRPVMTMPYAAKLFGMRDQIRGELSKMVEEGSCPIPEDKVWEASDYLSRVVYTSIGEVVVAARDAMDWLQDVARVAAKAGLPLRWRAPSGFPVVQDYRMSKMKEIKTTLFGGVKKSIRTREALTKLDKKKQANGVAPNFVHACDASHMMATVNKCAPLGMSLAMVHDSYGTHACDVGTMSYLLREAFVEQYNTDVLGDFRDEMVAQLPPELGEKIPPLPKAGDLELAQVLESDYFFA